MKKCIFVVMCITVQRADAMYNEKSDLSLRGVLKGHPVISGMFLEDDRLCKGQEWPMVLNITEEEAEIIRIREIDRTLHKWFIHNYMRDREREAQQWIDEDNARQLKELALDNKKAEMEHRWSQRWIHHSSKEHCKRKQVLMKNNKKSSVWNTKNKKLHVSQRKFQLARRKR